jgi:type III secretion protein N (ATPase)
MDADDIVADLARSFGGFTPVGVRGRVNKVVGTMVQATGIRASVGEWCELVTPGEVTQWAEVIGFHDKVALLTPLGPTAGLSAQTEVVPSGRGHAAPVGVGLMGRVVDALGQPMDDQGLLPCAARMPVLRSPLSPLRRRLIEQPLLTGIRAIDGLLTLGEGQRIGVFSPPGVGKSTLMGMLARGASADVIVVALVGERGREVKEFIHQSLGPAGVARSVIVVSTSDRPPMERIKCAYTATTMAEYFRDQGKRVLLLVDSLTRLARAQREVGLAGGEPPTRRSYPPSVFSMLPQLLERAGQGVCGSITALYTVLTEGDEENDPIAEEVRSILDGHIVLSRELAGASHYPAIDVLGSISRVMPAVAGPAHQAAAAGVRRLMARFKEIELLVRIGDYKAGQDAEADRAVQRRPAIQAFLQQSASQQVPWEQTVSGLQALAG